MASVGQMTKKSVGSWKSMPLSFMSDSAAVTPHPAIPPEALAAPGQPAAPLAVRSPLAASSTTAKDPVAVAPSRPAGVRYGTVETDPADTPRRRLPDRRRARSTDAQPAPCGQAEPCPAPTSPNPAQASPPDPAAARSTGSEIARLPADAATPLNPPYREGRQPGSQCVEGESDGTVVTVGCLRNRTRRGRCNEQPTADSARPRDGEAPNPCGLGANDVCRDHSYSRNNSSILRLAISWRPSMHLA